jgi:hypothetical protein
MKPDPNLEANMPPRVSNPKDSGDVTLAILGTKLDAMGEKLDSYVALNEKAHSTLWRVIATGFTIMGGMLLGVWVTLSMHIGQVVPVIK